MCDSNELLGSEMSHDNRAGDGSQRTWAHLTCLGVELSQTLSFTPSMSPLGFLGTGFSMFISLFFIWSFFFLEAS